MNSIRTRLLVLLLGGLGVVLVAGGAAIYALEERSLEQRLDAEVTARARSIAALVSYGGGRVEYDRDAGPPEDDPAGPVFEIRNDDGRLLRPSRNLGELELPVRSGEVDVPFFADVVLPNEATGRAAWLVFQPRIDEDEEEEEEAGAEAGPGLLVVTAAVNRGPTDDALTTLLGALLIVGSIVAVTIATLVFLGVRWGLVPLARLSQQLGAVPGNARAEPLDGTHAPRELVPVYDELNALIGRVGATLDRERAFVNAAAHELRTPLAELRSTAEVAIRWPETTLASTALQEMLMIGQEIERLVESLLEISRAEGGGLGAGHEYVALEPIVRTSVAKANGSVSEKGLAVVVNFEKGSGIRGPRDAVEIIVRNLVDNAIAYTPGGGAITIGGGDDVFTIENGPVELDADDLDALFRPFWRADGARSDRRHSGLGLTVVSRFAEAIGIRVEAALNGNRLQVRLGPV